jgi:hypothetical protein
MRRRTYAKAIGFGQFGHFRKIENSRSGGLDDGAYRRMPEAAKQWSQVVTVPVTFRHPLMPLIFISFSYLCYPVTTVTREIEI